MTIVDFYKELSRILTDLRENFISKNYADRQLEDLLDKAAESKLDIKISPMILDPINLMRLDDENSFSSEEDQYGYDGDSYISSY